MAWRLQLSSRPVRQVAILAGKPTVVAAWTTPHHVHLFDLQHGTPIDQRELPEPDGRDYLSATWAACFAALNAGNGVTLPAAQVGGMLVLSSADGSRRVIGEGSTLALLRDGAVRPIDVEPDTMLVACELERTGEALALLDSRGRLHLYRRGVRTGVFETGLALTPEAHPQLAVADGGAQILAADGRTILRLDMAGVVQQRFEAHYAFGTLAASPDGRHMALNDLDSGVMRVYNARTMTQTHQRFAVDLLADARRAQLLPVAVSPDGAVGPIAISSKGALAFSALGLLCVTSLNRMRQVGPPTQV